MVEVTGIDKLGESLLSQAGSRRAQLRKDLKKDQKRQQRAFLIGGALRFLDNAVGERYNNWYQNEANQTARRYLDRQKRVTDQYNTYKTDLASSGKTPFDYQKSLIESTLTEDELNRKIPGFSDLSDDRKNYLLYGEGDDKGLYATLAQQKVDALKQFETNFNKLDVDYEQSKLEWMKSNPYSKNLLGGAFNFLKKTLGKTPNQTAETIEANQLAELKKDTEAMELYSVGLQAGMSSESVLKLLRNDVQSGLKDKRYKRLGEQEGEAKLVEIPIVATLPSGRRATGTVKIYHQLMRLSNGDSYVKAIPISNRPGQSNFSEEEIAQSEKHIRENHGVVTTGEKTVTSASTGRSYTRTETAKADIDGNVIPGTLITVISDLDAKRVMDDPAVSDILPEVAKKEYIGFTANYERLSKSKTQKENDDADTWIDSLPFVPQTPAQKDTEVRQKVGAVVHLIDLELDDYNLQDLGFSREDQKLIAGQLLLIDNQAESPGSQIAGGVFKAASYDSVDPGKLLLAIELLRSEGELSRDHLTGKKTSFLTHDKLKSRLDDSGFFRTYAEAFSFNEKQEGAEDKYYDAGTVDFINDLVTRIRGEEGSTRRSLLDAQPKFDKEETVIPFKSTEFRGTVLDLMLGKPIIDPPPKETAFNIDTSKAAEKATEALSDLSLLQSINKGRVSKGERTKRSLLDAQDIMSFPENISSPDSLDRMVNFMLQRVQDNEDIGDIKEGPMNKILREARNITPEEREQFIRDSLAIQIKNTNQSIPNLIGTAISETNSNLEPTLVNAVFDIETNASDPIEVRTKEDSGHDAHGIGQIKTSTAVQPGFGADSIFDIADRLGIKYKGTLKTKALNQIRNNQQAGKFVSLKGAAAKEVIRLLQIPEVNTTFSVDYLTSLNKRYNGDKEKVLLAYNQGVSVADNWDGDVSSLNKEGRGYLEKARNLGAL